MNTPVAGRQAVTTQRQSGAGAGERLVDRAYPRLNLRRVALAVIVCVLALALAREMLIAWSIPDADLLDPFADANVYRAAGERLNAGHALYELGPGDRPVLILDTFTAPLLSPPPIAVAWRPIVLLPFGFELWNLACAVALLGTVVYLVLRIGLPAAVLAAALFLPIGEQLVAGNVAAFFPGVMVWTWMHRNDPRVGAVIGILAALKIMPGALAGWFVGVHRVPGAVPIAIGMLATTAVGLAGAGVSGYVDFLGVASSTRPSAMSLSSASGLPWLSFAVLIAGTLASASLWRQPRLSFVVAIVTLVAGSPALYFSTFVLLLAALAPLIPERDHAMATHAPNRSRMSDRRPPGR